MSAGKLSGRSVFITGAARGIGRAIAEAFAVEGAAVACTDISAEAAQPVADAIADRGGRALALGCDVRDSAAVRRAVDEAARALGGLHVLVCNAATLTPVAPLHELPEADWQTALDVNLTGAYLTCRHGIPHLLAAGGGSIVLLASQMGRVAWAGQAAYCTTKGALRQLAKGMALDYAPHGIRVNALSPGGVATDRLAARFGDLATAEREWGPKHPLGRLGRPEEIARAAVYLASEDSSFMTGADLLVDGGYTAW